MDISWPLGGLVRTIWQAKAQLQLLKQESDASEKRCRARNHTESLRKEHVFKKWAWFLKPPCSTDFAWSLACKPKIHIHYIHNIPPTWEFSFDFIELHVFFMFLPYFLKCLFQAAWRAARTSWCPAAGTGERGRDLVVAVWTLKNGTAFTFWWFRNIEAISIVSICFIVLRGVGLPEISGSRTVFSVTFASITTILSGASTSNAAGRGDSRPIGGRFAGRNFGKNDIQRHDQSHPSEAMTMPGQSKRWWVPQGNSVCCFCAWKVGTAWMLYHLFFHIFQTCPKDMNLLRSGIRTHHWRGHSVFQPTTARESVPDLNIRSGIVIRARLSVFFWFFSSNEDCFGETLLRWDCNIGSHDDPQGTRHTVDMLISRDVLIIWKSNSLPQSCCCWWWLCHTCISKIKVIKHAPFHDPPPAPRLVGRWNGTHEIFSN